MGSSGVGGSAGVGDASGCGGWVGRGRGVTGNAVGGTVGSGWLGVTVGSGVAVKGSGVVVTGI